VSDYRETLSRLTVGDGALIDRLLTDDAANRSTSNLDERTHALVRIAALIVMDAGPRAHADAIAAARRAGVRSEEIVGCLAAVLPAVGAARIVSAAPKLARALNVSPVDRGGRSARPGARPP
jgi:4-carboxymuconolactone decarboxylase